MTSGLFQFGTFHLRSIKTRLHVCGQAQPFVQACAVGYHGDPWSRNKPEEAYSRRICALIRWRKVPVHGPLALLRTPAKELDASAVWVEWHTYGLRDTSSGGSGALDDLGPASQRKEGWIHGRWELDRMRCSNPSESSASLKRNKGVIAVWKHVQYLTELRRSCNTKECQTSFSSLARLLQQLTILARPSLLLRHRIIHDTRANLGIPNCFLPVQSAQWTWIRTPCVDNESRAWRKS